MQLGSSGSAEYCRPVAGPSRGPVGASAAPSRDEQRLRADQEWDREKERRSQQKITQRYVSVLVVLLLPTSKYAYLTNWFTCRFC